MNKIQVTKAKKLVANDSNEYVEVNYVDIKKGDVLLVNEGDKIPADGEIIWGEASVDEAMISGESIPSDKKTGCKVIGGTVVVRGNLKMKAERVGDETVLSEIIELVKNAQNQKPSIQRLGDKVSAIFVPVVLLMITVPETDVVPATEEVTAPIVNVPVPATVKLPLIVAGAPKSDEPPLIE